MERRSEPLRNENGTIKQKKVINSFIAVFLFFLSSFLSALVVDSARTARKTIEMRLC